MKRQKGRTLKDELPRSIGAHYAAGEEWRNNSRKNEETEPKQKQHPVVDVTGDRSKIRYCKEQYCIGTWNVRSMNQGKLEGVKQGGNIALLSTENWIKDLLSMDPLIRIRPSFPLSQSLPSGSFHKPLILLHQRAENHNHRKLTNLITWTTALSNTMKL